MKKIFYCYSPPLQKELFAIGEKHIAKIVHPKTKRNCWLFLFTDNLVKYLDKRKKIGKKVEVITKNPKDTGGK